ncbi:MAG: hypothetical protein CSB24_04185 [Deltaproteobacteria bacterium]|nr:MAG: hypothetical protein CSB24_04185 [Deltaproteobacteria bacterium]
MNYLFRIIIFFGLILGFNPAAFAETGKSVLVSQDFTEILTKSLTEGTGIKVVRAVPANYSLGSQTSYIKKHWQNFANLCLQARAVISITGVWPEDPLYPRARRANIEIIPVDITSPLDQGRAGLPLLDNPQTGKILPFVWYSPGHAARMADIAAADLARIFPANAENIYANRDQLKRELFKLRTKYELAFGSLDYFEAVSLTADFYYLTNEFGIGMVKFFLKPEHKWQKDDLQQLQDAITSSGVKCVIAKWEPAAKIKTAIQEAGAKVVILKNFKMMPDADPAAQLLNFYKENLAALLADLSD